MNLGKLSLTTRNVFEELSGDKFLRDYILVGGSALTLRLGHRLSEDLDFIFNKEFLDSKKIRKFIETKFRGSNKLIKQDDNHQLDFLIDGVKVTFFSSGAVSVGFDISKYSEKYKNTNIATTEIISVLKMNAISQRNTIRDYYDLYFISKNIIPLKDIFDLTKKLMPNISDIIYTETILYSEDILDDSISEHLYPMEKITKLEISNYFKNEIKKIFNNKN